MSNKRKVRTPIKDKVYQLDGTTQWLAEQYGLISYRLNMLEGAMNNIIQALQGGDDGAQTPEGMAEGESTEAETGERGVREQAGGGLRQGAGEDEGGRLDLELAVRASDGQAGEADELHSGLPGPAPERGDDLLRGEGLHEGGREREAEDGGEDAADVPLGPDHPEVQA